MANRFSEIDALLKGIMQQDKPTLKELFEDKAKELSIPITAACKLIGMQHRSMKGILGGTQKIVDITTLIKLAHFLQKPEQEVIQLYMDAVQQHFPTATVSPEKIEFIKTNFDLAALKKAGIISSLSDYEQIESKLTARLGLKSIFEYSKPNIGVAFSSGAFNPKNTLTRSLWISAAQACFADIANPNDYDRGGLINLFPKIKKYSTNAELGLRDVTKLLYKIGITVIYQQPLAGLKLRGATFSSNNKPCIVLTDYKQFYSTLWFALIHELYHVLFDLDEIKIKKYHLTDDDNEEVSVMEREKEADAFAREYLFSKESTKAIRKYINDEEYVVEVADENQIHKSIIYAMNAFDVSETNRSAWAQVKVMSPDYKVAVKAIDIPFDEELEEAVKSYKALIKF